MALTAAPPLGFVVLKCTNDAHVLFTHSLLRGSGVDKHLSVIRALRLTRSQILLDSKETENNSCCYY